MSADVFQNAVTKGVRSISFGDLSGNLGRTMYDILFSWGPVCIVCYSLFHLFHFHLLVSKHKFLNTESSKSIDSWRQRLNQNCCIIQIDLGLIAGEWICRITCGDSGFMEGGSWLQRGNALYICYQKERRHAKQYPCVVNFNARNEICCYCQNVILSKVNILKTIQTMKDWKDDNFFATRAFLWKSTYRGHTCTLLIYYENIKSFFKLCQTYRNNL